MAKNIDLSETIRCAVQIEKNARDFYDHASKGVKAAKVRQVFEVISSDEQNHIALFEQLRARLETVSNPAQNSSGGYASYIQALIETTAFTQNKQGYEHARTIRNDKHGLELALEVEKETVLFYHEIKQMLSGDLHDDIDALIASEQEHVTKIAELLKGFAKFGVNRD